jgi:TRAP-type C4-dicarboxylate transport system permease small subunit
MKSPPSVLERALAVLAAALLFAMMLLTFVDVIMRYLFNAPIKGSFEISETLMAILIFAGLPLVSRAGEHVTIDSALRLASVAVRKFMTLVAQLGCAAALVGMAWLLYLKANRFASAGDVTQSLKLPIAPVVYLMALLTLVTAGVHLAMAWQRLRRPSNGELNPDDNRSVL